MSFALKISLNNELRRIPVDSTSLNFSEVRSRIQSLFGLPNHQNFAVRYTDEDGDQITIDSDVELQEAVALALSANKASLKIDVVKTEKPVVRESEASTAKQPEPAPKVPESSPNNNDDNNSDANNPLLTLAAAFAPQITAVLDQLVQDPKFMETATAFGLDLSDRSDPVKLVKQILEKPLLRELFANFPAGCCDGGNNPFANGGNPFATMFQTQNPGMQAGFPSGLAAMFGNLSESQGSPFPPHLAAMFGHQANPTPVEQDSNVVHRAICDNCQKIIVGTRWRCISECPDYDLCNSCVPDRLKFHPPRHIFARLAPEAPENSPPKQDHCHGPCGRRPCGGREEWIERQRQMREYREAQEAARASKETEPENDERRVELIGHETVGSGSILDVNQPFVKIWRVKNVGSTAWPAGCRIQFTDGERLGDHRALIGDGQEVLPGAEVRIALDCRASASPGPTRGVWRIVDRTGKSLSGDELAIDVLVIE